MKYEVDGWNNFCHVFELPKEYPKGFCFGGGKPVTFVMQDWFCPVVGMGQPSVTKEVWREKVGDIETKEVDGDEFSELLSKALSNKNYVKPDIEYLVICNFGLSFTFTKETV